MIDSSLRMPVGACLFACLCAPLLAGEAASTSTRSLDCWTYLRVDNERGKWGDSDAPKWLRYFGLDAADLTGDGMEDIVSGRHFYRHLGGEMTGKWQDLLVWRNDSQTCSKQMQLIEDAVDPSANDLKCFQIITPNAIYFLEKSGGGLSSLIDRDGNDWIGFHPRPGSGSAGEYRGFPNAVYRQFGSYFHPRNQGTDPSETEIVLRQEDQLAIEVRSSNQQWAGRYDFYSSHCTFTMTKMPTKARYWFLYEGTPGGAYDDNDWYITSTNRDRVVLNDPLEGDLDDPEWIAFGDGTHDSRVLFLMHHQDDQQPDHFYQMERQMTVFGFGRSGMQRHLDSVPQSVSIGIIESSDHAKIGRVLSEFAKETPL